ncbi:hypothetical protein D3C87_1538660 [compost metagenome]|uniref:hypothetical protein n=1 Tax=Achromobacter sp. Root83 TaxID=1736602 RepID=UPI000F9D4FD2|nr:hypothetical protein [Achromobacter sp. Root83]
MHLPKLDDARLIGCFSECDACKADMADACVAKKLIMPNGWGWNGKVKMARINPGGKQGPKIE